MSEWNKASEPPVVGIDGDANRMVFVRCEDRYMGVGYHGVQWHVPHHINSDVIYWREYD